MKKAFFVLALSLVSLKSFAANHVACHQSNEPQNKVEFYWSGKVTSGILVSFKGNLGAEMFIVKPLRAVTARFGGTLQPISFVGLDQNDDARPTMSFSPDKTSLYFSLNNKTIIFDRCSIR